MHTTREQLPVTFDAAGITFRAADWGEMRVTINSWPAGMDATPFLRGFPDQRCPVPHWGYVLKGRMRVTIPEGTETWSAGDLYYLPPGHTLFVEEDVDLLEFSPVEQMEMLSENLRGTFAEIEAELAQA